MSIINDQVPNEAAEQGARQIRHLYQSVFTTAESALIQIMIICEEHGHANIETALGGDSAELDSLYAAIKTFVETHKSSTSIPEMP